MSFRIFGNGVCHLHSPSFLYTCGDEILGKIIIVTPEPMMRALRLIHSVMFWLLLAALFVHAFPSYAADPMQVNDLAVLVDRSGKESITSVSQPSRTVDFRPVPHGFSAGFTRSVHWLRFTLHAPPSDAHGKREILLEIHPPYVDDLQIYILQPEDKGKFDIRKGGDLQPPISKEYPYRAFAYRVAFDDVRPRTVYVRLQTSSSSVLTVKVWAPSAFIERTSREYILLGLLFGVILAVMLANVWHGLWRREAIYRRYIAYLLATFSLLLGINGLVGEFLFPTHPLWAHHWVSLSNLLIFIFGTHFYMLALEINTAALWMRWIYRTVFWLSILCLPTPLIGLYLEAIRILMPLALLLLLTGVWRSVQLWRQRNANGKILLLAHFFGLAGALATVLTLFGLLPGHFFLIYGFQLGTVGTLLALQWMMGHHVRVIEAQKTQASMEVEIAKATAQQERAEREHQRHFLSMLTHELKTPLSVIRLRLGAINPTIRMQAHAKQAVQDIDVIVERCAMVSRMGDSIDRPQFAHCDINELLIEILAQQTAAGRVMVQLTDDVSATSIQSDPLLLRTILSNLIDNALRYSPPEDEVHITATFSSEEGREGINVKVENLMGSAGMPDPLRLFDKFYRAPRAHQHSGTGLGLYIAKAFAEQLSGILRFRPQTDRVIFELWLPL